MLRLFHPHTRQVFRGGVILVALSALSMPILRAGMRELAPFAWISMLWLVFPVGAWLSTWLPGKYESKSRFQQLMRWALIGLLIGVVLGSAVATFFSTDKWVGLLHDASPDYRVSLRDGLLKMYWHMLLIVPPISALITVMWGALNPKRPTNSDAEITEPIPGSLKRLFLCFFLILGTSLGSAVIFFLSGIFMKGKAPLLALVGFGLPLAGPLIGPIVNPGGGTHFAAKLLTVGIVPLGLTMILALVKKPLKPGITSFFWACFFTALLFWMSLGIFSLGWSLG